MCLILVGNENGDDINCSRKWVVSHFQAICPLHLSSSWNLKRFSISLSAGFEKILPEFGKCTYSKSPHIRTYFFESQAEVGSYFKDTMTNIREKKVLI